MTENPSSDADAPAVSPPPDAVETAETGEAAAPAAAETVRVPREDWVARVTAARDEGYDFFSWLSAIDWAREVAVGDPVESPDELDERYEVLCALSTVVDDRYLLLSTDVPKDDAVLDTLVGVFGGAAWHEREAHEMFGIDFRGHPRLLKLYLPDAFEGFPLRKSYPLLSREVKPWPGLVDVEDMPSTENTEADASAEAAAGDTAADDGADDA